MNIQDILLSEINQAEKTQKSKGGFQEDKKEAMEGYCLMSTEFLFHKMKRVWRQMTVGTAQNDKYI
jgi:hypothetical protein